MLMQLIDCKSNLIYIWAKYLDVVRVTEVIYHLEAFVSTGRRSRRTKRTSSIVALYQRIRLSLPRKIYPTPLGRLATIRGSGRAGKKKASNMAGCPDLDLSQKISSFREKDSRRKVQ